MHLLPRHDPHLQDVAEHEVVVHGLGDDGRDGGGGEFEEGVVLGGAGGAVAREAQAEQGAELGEVGAHLGLVEAVGDAAAGGGLLAVRRERERGGGGGEEDAKAEGGDAGLTQRR